MRANPQTVTFKDERFFICEYTGAFIKRRYYLPSGPRLNEKSGCFITLPVLLRAMVDSGKSAEEIDAARHLMREVFEQPNVPVQPRLDASPPLNEEGVAHYLAKQELGLNWLLVPASQTIEEFDESLKPKKRRVKRGARHDD